MEAEEELLRDSTILIVDDEPEIANSLKTAIERSVPRVRVLTASNAQSGLFALDHERVDVILSDHNMPGMRGIDFLTEARKRAPGAARIMLTAFPDEQIAMRAINDAKLDHFFTKPFRLSEVMEKLRAILDDQRQRDLSRLAFARTIDVLRQEAERSSPREAPVPMRKTPRPFRGDL